MQTYMICAQTWYGNFRNHYTILSWYHNDVRHRSTFCITGTMWCELPVVDGSLSLRTSNENLWCLLGCYFEQAAALTFDVPMICDTMNIMWCHCKLCNDNSCPIRALSIRIDVIWLLLFLHFRWVLLLLLSNNIPGLRLVSCVLSHNITLLAIYVEWQNRPCDFF